MNKKKISIFILVTMLFILTANMSFAEQKQGGGLDRTTVEMKINQPISDEFWSEITQNGELVVVGAADEAAPDIVIKQKSLDSKAWASVRINSFATYSESDNTVYVTSNLYSNTTFPGFTAMRGVVTVGGDGLFESDIIDVSLEIPSARIGSVNPVSSSYKSGKTYTVESGGRGYGIYVDGGSGPFLISYPIRIP